MSSLQRTLLLVLAALVLPSAASAQGGPSVTFRDVNIDYYLLRYFNRLAPLPPSVKGGAFNGYPVIGLFSPVFNFVNHDLDFGITERTVRTMGMGGAGLALSSGAGALPVNPGGIARSNENEIYVGASTRFGGGESGITDDLLIKTGIVGDILPFAASVDPRFSLGQGGLYIAGRPFGRNEELAGGIAALLGRVTVAAGYRRYVEVLNPTNVITDGLPEGGLQGLSAELKFAAQSREKGGVDAVTFGLSTGVGRPDGPLSLTVGGAANAVSGRIRADQVFTVSQLTQIQVNLPGNLGLESFVAQKYQGTSFDLGAQVAIFDGTLAGAGFFRPGYTLEVRSGRYQAVESGLARGDPASIDITRGTIADYDMEIPRTLKAGGALRLEPLLGDGIDRNGILGLFHRFLGRSTVAVDYEKTNLSEATVQHTERFLDNSHLVDDPLFEAINFSLAQQFGPEFVVDPVVPLANTNALLRDKSAVHVGFETPIWDRETWSMDLRLGYETVPLGFPSLVLGAPRDNADGLTERPVLMNDDGTPMLEDVEGTAFSLGLGYETGAIAFEMAFRSASYDFVTWWSGTQAKSIYNPDTRVYESVFLGTDEVSGLDVSRKDSYLQLGARLSF